VLIEQKIKNYRLSLRLVRLAREQKSTFLSKKAPKIKKSIPNKK
jgi:hypothetical protein